MLHPMEIRSEQPIDIAAIRQVNFAAFGRSGEADLVDRLRGQASTFSLVAVDAGQIIGYICFSPVTIVGASSNDLFLLGLAPVAVLPEYQKQGIGSSLVRQGVADGTERGCHALFVLGSPQYYAHFGFSPAKHQGLVCEYDVPEEAFMVLELAHGALAQSTGTVKYHPEFSRIE